LYELNWHEDAQYVANPSLFRGFFAGEGNRTYIPNQFFDHLIPRETLAVLKVVGSVIRFSIGFQNKWGHRRQQIALSFTHIQRYSRIASRQTLSNAIKLAVASNYIQRVEEGYFDPDAGKLSKVAVYGLRWLSTAVEKFHGQKSVPGQVSLAERSEKRTGDGRKNVPEERSEIRTGIEITRTNKTLKQQPTQALRHEGSQARREEDTAAAAVAFERLRAEGFDGKAAKRLAESYPIERILNQIDWIGQRQVSRNRLGMLRRAIEEGWGKPGVATSRAPYAGSGTTGPDDGFAAPPLGRGTGFTGALEAARRKYVELGGPVRK
jgi:hypothetical protein